jgi:hypothetical protein
MAGDWIKIEHTTPDKPEVVTMADLIGIDQDAVTGKLLRLWIWVDQQSVDGNAVSVTNSFLDRLVFCPGFAAAMRKVGWIEGRDSALTFPDLDRHNGQTAKQRAASNRRVAKSRSCNAPAVTNVTLPPLQKPLPEKRREEKNEERERTRSPATVDPLCGKINSASIAWESAPAFGEKETAALGRNRAAVEGIPDEMWPLLRRYLTAFIPEGAPRYQPQSRQRFIEGIGDVVTYAVGWQAKQPRPPKPKPSATPSDEPDMTPEQIAAFCSAKP